LINWLLVMPIQIYLSIYTSVQVQFWIDEIAGKRMRSVSVAKSFSSS
jgi:hypothetical protein